MGWRRVPDEAAATVDLEVGDAAPDFTLRRTFQESVNLSELLAKGPVLLLFYVFDYGQY